MLEIGCGFQILHAYYTLERAVLEFKRRSANFEIVFWEGVASGFSGKLHC